MSDVTDKLGVLLYEIGELEDQYVDRYDQYRVTMKSIRNIEASVQPSRDSKNTPQPAPATLDILTRRRKAKNYRPDCTPEIQGAKFS